MHTRLRLILTMVVLFLMSIGMVHGQTFDDYELDTMASSYSNAFTIHVPGDLLSFSSIARAPDNITLTNNWNIFTADGIVMDEGDVLLIVDFYDDATALNLADVNGDSSVRELAEALMASQPRESAELTGLIAGDYDGFQFTAVDASGLILHTAIIDLPEGEVMSFLLITATLEEQDIAMPLFVDIIASVETGVVFDRETTSDLELTDVFVRQADNFTMPYPEGWMVEVSPLGQSEFVTVTRGHPFSMESPPIPGQPSAIIAYGSMQELTGLPASMLNPETNAVRVVQQIIGANRNDITSLVIKGRRAAQAVSTTPNFDNWFVAIMLDDAHFIAANMFTAPQSDEAFFGTVIEMVIQSRWDALGTDYVSTGEPRQFTSANSGLSMHIPAGWKSFDLSSEIIALINVDDAFSKLTSQDTPDSGQVIVTIFTHKLINTIGTDLESRLASLNETVFTEGVDDLQEMTFDDHIFYAAEATGDEGDKLVLLLPVDDNYVLMSVQTAPGELDGYRETLMDIARSIIIDQE